MRQGSRFVVVAAMALLASSIAGCSPTQSPTPPPTSTSSNAPATPPSSPAPTQASGLPDPGLATVKTELGRARGAVVTPAGGTVSATGSNGAVYTLTIPAGALADPRQIDLYPVTSLANLPAGASMTAGVQFSPDGLQLLAPATLSIALPSAVDPALTGMAWHGDGTALRRAPVNVVGQVVTLSIDHFSGAGIWLAPADFAAALGCAQTDYTCLTDAALDLFSIQRRTSANLGTFLRTWYRDVVDPFLQAEGRSIADDATSSTPDLDKLTHEFIDVTHIYGAWYTAINTARGWLRSSSFTVAPELPDSRVRLIGTLRQLYAGFNGACAKSGDDYNRAIEAANRGVTIHHASEAWGIATRASGLDYLTLLLQSCVQVVLDPVPTYTGTEPGDNGSVEVQAGFRIQGLEHIAPNIQVEANLTGTNHEFVAFVNQFGHYSMVIPWPAGLASVRFDIVAKLNYDGALGTVQTEIFNATNVSKDADDLFRSTFDIGFDGWAHDTSGCQVCQADHESIGGGVIHLDGRGATSSPKAWIFRSFTLPASARHLFFDVSAEHIAGSSSSVAVLIVGADGSETLLLRPTTVHNSTNRLSFVHKRLDISRWAGQTVTIYIEQTYNQVGNFDKELYIDNVRITAV